MSHIRWRGRFVGLTNVGHPQRKKKREGKSLAPKEKKKRKKKKKKKSKISPCNPERRMKFLAI